MPITTRICRLSGTEEDGKIYREAGEILRRGGLVAFPTETVYGLGANALDAGASAKIYAAKGRPSDNPLIVHIAERGELDRLAAGITPEAEILMEDFWPGPMTLIFSKKDAVPKETTGGLMTVAVRMPEHPAARELIREAGVPVAAPSANLSGKPSPTRAEHVIRDLDGRVDMILDGGPVPIGLESTIIDMTGEEPEVLRPGRIRLEEIRAAVGRGKIDPAAGVQGTSDMIARAPGMKYRHYAPEAELTLVLGPPEAAAEKIRGLAEDSLRRGRRTAVLCPSEDRDRYPGIPVIPAGSSADPESTARELYRCLRALDEDGIEEAYTGELAQEPFREAVLNRLKKAAAHIITTGETE